MHPSSTITLHFHGIHQKGTPYADGPAYVTNCPLGPLESQEYVFNAYPAGTHFWHAHASLHAADGITGPLIVRPTDPEPFEYDEEVLMFLQDWYISTGTQQVTGLFSWPFVWIGNPNSLLINGNGTAPECLSGGANFGNENYCLSTCNGTALDLLNTTTVDAGKTYRLRIINSAQLVMMNFVVANHNMTIVQVEGTNVEHLVVETLDIAPGHRYDVLVTADQTPGSYWIETTVRERSIPTGLGRAIWQYSSVEAVVPDMVPTHPEWNDTAHGVAQESALFTLDPEQYSEVVALSSTDVSRYVLVGTQNQLIVDGEIQRLLWAVNNVSNIPHGEPLISKAVRAVKELGWPTELEDSVEMPLDPPFVWNYTMPVWEAGGPGPVVGSQAEVNIYLEEGQVFELVLQNARALNNVTEFHPWHAHGHSFWVVGQGDGIFDPDTDVAKYNLKNPVLRDTVTLWPLQWVAIRFVANNPGVWFFHCHIPAHEMMGMGLHIVTSPDKVEDPPSSVTMCSNQALESGVSSRETNSNDASSGEVRSWSLGLIATLCLYIAALATW